MWSKKSLRVFIVLIAVASVWSCKSRKVVMEGKPIRNLNTSRIIDSVMKYQFAPGYFSSKLSVDAELPGDNSQSMKLNLRMRLDSLVWGQVSVMALNAAQMLITQDSVHMLVFLSDNKGYYPRSIDYLSELLNTDLELRSLQDIFLGNPLRFDPEEKYKSPADTGFYYLSSHRKRKIRRAVEHDRAPRKNPVIYQYRFYPGTFKTYQVNISDVDDSTTVNIIYPEYEMVDSVLVPAAAEIEAVKGNKKVKLSLRYSRTKVNQKLEFPFNVPENYERK